MEIPSKIFSATRSYEYRIDDIRLTALTLPDIVNSIEDAFGFQSGDVRTPPALFGPVPRTSPPGLVFDIGVMVDTEIPTPIRFLHVEQRRIVICVAGPSSAIDIVFDQFSELTADVLAPDGSQAVGAHTSVRDRSDISLTLPFLPEELIAPSFHAAFRNVLSDTATDDHVALVPTIQVSMEALADEYDLAASNARSISLEIRAGTRPEEMIFYSQAPLDTDRHLDFLKQLMERHS